ncbi:MAG: hypothetical protein IH587_07945 [Anaerolineae bacterium]|nr:hypothetical protein [Anaerolineae bacterium]
MMPDHDPLHDAYHLLASGKVPARNDNQGLRPPPFDPSDPRFIVRARKFSRSFTLMPASFVARILSIFFA